MSRKKTVLFALYLLPANEVWGKVIFSVACVKNSVHRGGGCLVPGGVPGPGRGAWSRGMPGSGGLVPGGGWSRGVGCLVQGGGVPGPGGWLPGWGGLVPGSMWRPSDGYCCGHPTGMYSCFE